MLVKTFSAIVQGLQATAVTIEVNATRGIRFVLVGLPEAMKLEQLFVELVGVVAFKTFHHDNDELSPRLVLDDAD